MTMDGLYLDDSYVDEKSDVLKAVHVVYTVGSDNNFDVNYHTLKLKIGENSYEGEHIDQFDSLDDKIPNVIHTDVLNDTTIYAGESRQVLVTYLVPEADLEAGKEITFSDSEGLGSSNIKMSTNDIIRISSVNELAQAIDPNGYASYQAKYNPATADTAEVVSNQLNGYYFATVYNGMSIRYEFAAPNAYTATVSGQSTTGTYEVLNGFIKLTVDSTGYESYAPYTLDESGKLNVSFLSATLDGNQP